MNKQISKFNTLYLRFFLKEATMLGKVRGIAIAIMMMGIMGACAQAGTLANEYLVTGDNINWNDIKGGADLDSLGNVTFSPTSVTLQQDSSLTTGYGGVTGNVIVNGSTINLADHTLTLNKAQALTSTPSLIFQGAANTVNAGTTNSGKISADAFNMSVRSNLALNGAIISVNNLSQISGTISGDGRIETKGTGRISGKNTVYAASGIFNDGVLFTNGATLQATNNTVTTTTGDVTFQNGTLDLTDYSMTINGPLTFDNASKLIVGLGNAVTVTGLFKGSLANIVTLDNNYITNLYKDPMVDFGENSLGEVSHSFLINNNSTLMSPGKWSTHNVFGDYSFENNETKAWLDTYNKTDINNIDQVKGQLSKTYTPSLMTNGIASDVSVVANSIIDGNIIAYNDAGNFNYAALEAMAYGKSPFSWANGSGIIDKGLIGAMNGSNLAGVNYVAQDVARDIFTTLHSRLDAYRAVAVDIASDSALCSVASVADQLNDRYLNRLWAGGIGSWSNANERKGFDGYKYNGKGVVLGYDRAVCAAIFGIAGAYIEGDYEDKAASAHDSKISNYALNAYMTYNASSGFFTTLSGGWVYSDNDIRERRGGLWAREDYNTHTWHAEAKLGYDIQPCDNWSVSPSIGVNFFHAEASAHDMNIEGVANSVRSYSKAKNHMVEIPVEIQAAYEVPLSDVTRVTLMANAGYAYNLNDHAIRGQSVTNGINGVAPAQIVGRKLGHNSWKAGAGITFRHDQWDVGVKYDYYGRNSYHNHRVMGSIGYSF